LIFPPLTPDDTALGGKWEGENVDLDFLKHTMSVDSQTASIMALMIYMDKGDEV
jgi:hypothetical protein